MDVKTNGDVELLWSTVTSAEDDMKDIRVSFSYTYDNSENTVVRGNFFLPLKENKKRNWKKA